MHSFAEMITSLTTAFDMALPTREIRLIDEFLLTFDELTKVLVLLLFKRCVIGMRLFVQVLLNEIQERN